MATAAHAAALDPTGLLGTWWFLFYLLIVSLAVTFADVLASTPFSMLKRRAPAPVRPFAITHVRCSSVNI